MFNDGVNKTKTFTLWGALCLDAFILLLLIYNAGLLLSQSIYTQCYSHLYFSNISEHFLINEKLLSRVSDDAVSMEHYSRDTSLVSASNRDNDDEDRSMSSTQQREEREEAPEYFRCGVIFIRRHIRTIVG